MSYLANALEELMKEKEMRPRALARATGVDEATISRWRSGQQLSITEEDLEAVAKALSNEPREQAKLLVARLRDLCRGPGADLIEIRLGGHAVREEAVAYGTKLPPHLERAFLRIRSNVMHDADLREIILHLGNLYDESKPKPK